MGYLIRTTRFTRSRLPHWEVEGARYFVTVRCADSLPANVVARLAEVHCTLMSTEPVSVEYARLQRQYFLTMEKYLDAGAGQCPLRDPCAAQILFNEFTHPERTDVTIPHFTIMPNHWHGLIAPRKNTNVDLRVTLSRLKGRTARATNAALGRTRALWQREWFDRWIRDDPEWERFVDYIQRNPVKAALVHNSDEHPWTR